MFIFSIVPRAVGHFLAIFIYVIESNINLLNLSRPKTKTNVREAMIGDMLFSDDAAVSTHTQEQLQTLMIRFSEVCMDFRLTFSLKKTNGLGQYIDVPPIITIDDYELEIFT